MTPREAIEVLQGPRRLEIQALLDAFFTAWGYTLAHHSRSCQFGALLLWIEERGARLPEAPEEQAGVAGQENEKKGE